MVGQLIPPFGITHHCQGQQLIYRLSLIIQEWQPGHEPLLHQHVSHRLDDLKPAGILDALTAKIPLCRLGVQAWTVQLEFSDQDADYSAAERYSISLRHIPVNS